MYTYWKVCVNCMDLLFRLTEGFIFIILVVYPKIIALCLNINDYNQYMVFIILVNVICIVTIPPYFSLLQYMLYKPRYFIFSCFTIYFPLKGYAYDLITIYCNLNSSWTNINDFIMDRSQACKKQPAKLRRRIITAPTKSLKKNNIRINIRHNMHTLEFSHLYIILQHQWYISSSYISLINNILKRTLLFIITMGTVVEYYQQNKLICFQVFTRNACTLSFFYHYSTKEAKKMHLVGNAIRIGIEKAIEINKNEKAMEIKYFNLTLNDKSSCTSAKQNCCFEEVDHRIDFDKSYEIYFGSKHHTCLLI
eukprot:290961_1